MGFAASGESFSRQVWFCVDPFVRTPDQLPVWPPALRASVTPVPEPEMFHPEVSASKPAFFTKSTSSEAVAVFVPSAPVTVCLPPEAGVQTLPLHDPSGEIENAVADVTLPSELFDVSKPCAVKACELPTAIFAVAGVSAMWSSGPAFTWSEAVPEVPSSVPVTVCAPLTLAVQVAPEHVPSGQIRNVVLGVASPSELSYRSRPWAVYVRDPPAAMVADAGESARWSSAPATTVNVALLVLPASVPVIVCVPATVAVQTFAVHEPSGMIAKLVCVVTSPTELFAASNPSAVYVCATPAVVVAGEGLTTM